MFTETKVACQAKVSSRDRRESLVDSDFNFFLYSRSNFSKKTRLETPAAQA